MLSALKEFVGIKPRSYTLSVPRIEENEGLLLFGDPGTGKSQVIHQLLDNIAKRKPQEAVVVYDRQASSSKSISIPTATLF
jgi:DNA replication protein DnaC